ncbi:MAG: hypothetical protein IJB27_04965 [Clostridia bacterium]|nr:hypothetical protein [Clostridia bacterium]
MKKLLSVFLAITLLCVAPFSVYAFNLPETTLNTSSYATLEENSLFSPEFVSRQLSKRSLTPKVEAQLDSRESLPTSVDNSTSLCFPVIGSQGDYGSCGAWASVYYAYTYEVNRLHNTPARELNSAGQYVNIEENVYSPTWVYDVMTGAHGAESANIDWCFEFSQFHGQLSLADLPYYGSGVTYPNLPTDTEKIVGALSTRISSWEDEVITIDTQIDGLITSPGDTQLDAMKSALADGHVLVVAASWAFETKTANNGEEIAYRFHREPGKAHAVTVVGYSDVVGCDINGDGQITMSERGAFKIANSHGLVNNKGFLWVSYDALNHITSVSSADDSSVGWDQSDTTTRAAAFGLNFDINWMLKMNVADYDVQYACVIDSDIRITDHLNIYLKRSKDDGSDATDEVHYHSGANYMDVGDFSCILAYDYEALANPIEAYLSGYTWHMRSSHPESITINSCTMYDNAGQLIKPFSYVQATDTWQCDLDLILGDVDYDGSLTITDFTLLYSHAGGQATLPSNLQLILADMNSDGAINTQDALLLYAVISNNLAADSPQLLELQQVAEELLIQVSGAERD